MNTVNLIGRTTRDIELKYTQSGTAVCKFSIAIGKKYVKDDEKVEEVSYIEVECWAKNAENVARYVSKGNRVAVVGSLKQSRWEQDGVKRSKLYVVAQNVEFLETKPKSNEAENSAPDNNNNGWAE